MTRRRSYAPVPAPLFISEGIYFFLCTHPLEVRWSWNCGAVVILVVFSDPWTPSLRISPILRLVTSVVPIGNTREENTADKEIGPAGPQTIPSQSVQHPADRAVVHSGSPYPSPCRGIWGIEAALRSLSQRATPAAVMLAAASSQEERHRLGRLLSSLGGGSLHPDWRPRDMNCGAGPSRQVTERREGRNVQSVKDS